MQMGMMIESFSTLTKNINHNFTSVHNYIKDLQKSKQHLVESKRSSRCTPGSDVKRPKFKKLQASIEQMLQRPDNYQMKIEKSKAAAKENDIGELPLNASCVCQEN